MLKEIAPNVSGGEHVRWKLNVFKHAANGITDFCPCQLCIPFNSNDPLYRQLLDLRHYEFIDIMNGPISSELPPTFPLAMCFVCNWPMIFGVWFHWLGSKHFQQKWNLWLLIPTKSSDYLTYFTLDKDNFKARCKLRPDHKRNVFSFSNTNKFWT